MSDLIYQCSKPVFVRNLKSLAGILETAEADAKSRGIEPSVILNSRLSPDMFPLTRQVQIVTDHAKGCCARLACVDNPVLADNETTFDELDQRIRRTLDFLGGLKASRFAGSETREIVLELPIGMITFNALDYLNGWALPNFYFHYSTAYNILRHNGVGIGKRDFLGAVPAIKVTGKIAKMLGIKPAGNAKKKNKKKKKS
ncbi:MAG TPA: DUF1993 domain-containing protein [Halioglobus sp.]